MRLVAKMKEETGRLEGVVGEAAVALAGAIGAERALE
jgi:hypothetical protein